MGSIIAIPITITLTILSTKLLDLDFWCKWITSYLYIKLSKLGSRRRFDLYDMTAEHDPYKVCFLPPPEEAALESPIEDSRLISTTDEVFCYGMNSKSESLTVCISRRPDNESDAWIQVTLDDGRMYELKETSGFQQSCCDKKVFSCGDLQMHYISPMRQWRIFFNGLMRETSDKSTEKMVHVKFALLWKATSDPFDFATDVSPSALATGLANVKWNRFLPPLEKFKRAMDIYSQTGVILGNVTIEEDEEDHNLYLFGEKIRFLGDLALSGDMELYQILGRTTKDGRYMHLVEASIPNIVEKLQFGFIVQPTGSIKQIPDASIAVEYISNQKKENKFLTSFHAKGKLYELKGKLLGEQGPFNSNNGGQLTIDHFNLQINALNGSGIILKGKRKGPVKRLFSRNSKKHTVKVIPCVVNFSNEMCQDSEITGGKGSSLGKLTSLSKQIENFVVPNGIVVTTAAYQKFLTTEVLHEIINLENSLCKNKNVDIKSACQRVIDKVLQSAMPAEICEEIDKHLQKEFPKGKNMIQFAVRSSATGEDTEQMSAAGQMETYLGVTAIDEIMLAVKKCWGSQFSHIAVQYKRQNGQVLNSPMAVVIQQMVSCDVAGVLFTCDPLTGNPTRISITANYGLGETVVSGSEEPDTIELRKYDDDKLSVENKIIGSKCRRIVVKDGEGTHLEVVPEHQRTTCCLTDEMALQLGDLAVKLHKSYRSHRDIEWGFWNNTLYIFQSRPVTSGTGETDFEIDHEQDAPLRVENEYFTVCNVGEVMPGAMSPLGLEVLIKFFSIIFQRPNAIDSQEDAQPNYSPCMMCSMYKHVMFYCVEIYKRIDEKSSRDATSISMFSRLIEDEDMFELAKMRHGGKKVGKIAVIKENFNRFLMMFYGVKTALSKCQKFYANYQIPIEKFKTAQELFDGLMFSCSDLSEIFACHMMCSETSSVWNIIMLSILQSAGGELSSDVYSDFGQLLKTSSDVESADVPSSLEELSSCISKDMKPDAFKKMDSKEAVQWLQTTASESGLKYREFLSKHGHRCLREFDLRSETWQTNPSSLIHLLQNTVGTDKRDRNDSGSEDITVLLSKLKTPLDFIQKLILKMLIPKSRKAVQNREISKSLLIRGVDAWRKGYTRLSQLMASEGRIPDADLLFFMSLEEIKEILSSRSPKIIARANHRRRRLPILDQYIFSEITKGVPIPINMTTNVIATSDDTLTLKGIPVSQGIATGFVRVAITLEEASLLKAGEILVTYSTDIGWSPYFPLLSGVVTEIGGLISHGAVVSREYGLPCIAGLHGATRQFQTGDYVLLDGNKGFLQKIPKPENL